MSSDTTEFLKEKIYPSLNAVEAGLLDNLFPRRTGSAYLMNCPKCGKKSEAFYYPGRNAIICNRKSKCGKATTIWDFVEEDRGLEAKFVLELLADKAGVALPDSDNKEQFRKTDIVKKALKYGLEKSEKAQHYLLEQRRWTKEEIERAPFGYIHSFEYFVNRLRKLGFSEGDLEEWGFLSELQYSMDPEKFESSFNQRIVGWWEQDDGKLKLWGRDVTGTRHKKKYKNQTGVRKAMPCYWNEDVNRKSRENLIFVEGQMDACRLMVNGIGAVALGGNTVTEEQSYFIAKYLSSYTHWIDADPAGFRGAVSAISNTSYLSIYSYIFMSDKAKDADEYLSGFTIEEMVSDVSVNSMGCGRFVAQRFQEAVSDGIEQGGDLNPIFTRARMIANRLTGLAKVEYFQLLDSYGLKVEDGVASALRAMADLIESGIDRLEAKRIINNRFNVEVDVESY